MLTSRGHENSGGEVGQTGPVIQRCAGGGHSSSTVEDDPMIRMLLKDMLETAPSEESPAKAAKE